MSCQISVVHSLFAYPSNAKQVDSIESMSMPSYFHGNIWITITSTWDIYTAYQQCYIIPIHHDKMGKGCKCHFDVDHNSFEFLDPPLQSFDDFLAVYTVHTAGMSGALSKEWTTSSETICQEYFRHDIVPEVARQAMLGSCTRHYKANVHKVTSISKFFSGKEKQEEFKEMETTLIDSTLEFFQFRSIVKQIERKFPDIVSWLTWYLNPRIVPHIFPACNSARDNSKLVRKF